MRNEDKRRDPSLTHRLMAQPLPGHMTFEFIGLQALRDNKTISDVTSWLSQLLILRQKKLKT